MSTEHRTSYSSSVCSSTSSKQLEHVLKLELEQARCSGLMLSPLSKPVSSTTYGDDVVRRLRIIPQPLPQRGEVRLHCPRFGSGRVAPHLAQQLRARDD